MVLQYLLSNNKNNEKDIYLSSFIHIAEKLSLNYVIFWMHLILPRQIKYSGKNIKVLVSFS